ncbi:MAG: hypothetical protein ACHQUB_03810 [Candidatus Saccharimonadia bacterium]
MNPQILIAAFSIFILLLFPVSATAGIPGVKTITLLYWSDPLLILIVASVGFVIARRLRWLPTERSAMVLYFILIPITVASIPIAWMIESVIYVVRDIIFPLSNLSVQTHPLLSWLTVPSYWYLDDPESLRAVFRFGILFLSLVISVAYQVLILKTITREFGIRNSLKASAAISGIAYLILLFLASLMPYSDLSWPR